MKNLLSEEDGWYDGLGHPQQHYFFKNHSLCGLFSTLPKGAHHDNDPLKHCEKCTKTVNKLLSVASAIVGKKLSPNQVMNLIEALESMKLNKGTVAKEIFPEGTVAVIGHSDGTKTTLEVEPKKYTKTKYK